MGDKRSDALFHKRRNGYWTLSETEQEAMKGYCEGYKLFLDKGRTEREVAALYGGTGRGQRLPALPAGGTPEAGR